MEAENSFSSPRSPLRFDRMPDHTQRSFWDGPSSRRPSPGSATPPATWRSVNNGRRALTLRRGTRWRRDLLMEDMKDLFGRAVIYALALLGLLHVLGLVAMP